MLALTMLCTSAAATQAKERPPAGELLLDMTDPVIELKVGSVPLRLRVGLEQKRLIELNPGAVDRLRAHPPDRKFRFEDGFDAEIGRETLKGIAATAMVRINDRNMPVTLSSHERDCCADVDGEIGIGLLPFATIRFVRVGAGKSERSFDFLIDDDDEHGPQTMVTVGWQSLFVQFSLNRAESVATSSAGAILAQNYGGRLGREGTIVAAFGIVRPMTMLTFRRPAQLAGFRFDRIPVRTADFAGTLEFPVDPDEPADADDIIVAKRTAQQRVWPVVMIGRDQLDSCGEMLYDTGARRMTLRCAP